MSPLVRRNRALREVRSTNRDFYPEVIPGERLQAILNSTNLQGGGVVRLGPYSYYMNKTLKIPENVTLVGVPRKTKLILRHIAGGTVFGPVVELETKSKLTDCYVSLELAYDAVTDKYYGFDGDTAVLQAPDTSRVTYSDTDNCTVLLSGARAFVQGCVIPGETTSKGTGRRGILVTASDCFVLGNEIEVPDNDVNLPSSIFLNTGVNGCVVMQNWCESTASVSIKFKSGTTNVIGPTGAFSTDSFNYAQVGTH